MSRDKFIYIVDPNGGIAADGLYATKSNKYHPEVRAVKVAGDRLWINGIPRIDRFVGYGLIGRTIDEAEYGRIFQRRTSETETWAFP